MARSKHNGCGRATCGICKPHKKWKGQKRGSQKPGKARDKTIPVEDSH